MTISKIYCQPLMTTQYHPKPPDLKDINFGHNKPVINTYGYNFKTGKDNDNKVIGRKLDKQM